jgi:hypothetical protein
VVVLAPLDSPPLLGRRGTALLADGTREAWRLAACALLALLAVLGLLLPGELTRGVLYAQGLPVAMLVGAAAIELRATRRERSPGAVSHAGGLAALLAVAETTEPQEEVELWAVALGATASFQGVADLLRRYPFDRDTTLFVSVEGIGAGSLCFVSRGDAPGRLPADALLLEVAHDAGAEAPSEAGPRTYRGGWSVAGRLRAAGMRSIAVMCLDAEGRVPLRGSLDDTPAVVDGALLERAALLVADIVRRLETGERMGRATPPSVG